MAAPISDSSPAISLAAQVHSAGMDAGLAAVGFTTAEILQPARQVLKLRKNAGLAAEMQFTYRNPDRSTDPSRVLEGAQSIVSGALSYGAAVEPKVGEGRVGRYAVGNHYADLRVALEAMAAVLVANGYQARVHLDDNNLVDRNVAWRAGIGWYGKNANLLVPGVGSWVVLGNVVTDAPLRSASQPLADGCGPCRRCLDGCPTNAIVAPGVIDASKCIAWVVQGPAPIPVALRDAIGDRIYGCDECQDVCPESPDPSVELSQDPIEILFLLHASDEELLAKVGHWYIANRDPNVVRRTALVVLGNTGNAEDVKVKETLAAYCESENEQLRSHAQWAAAKLGLAS